ncbi:tRNA 2-thiouridine(34) synthase MnmA [Anaerosalibacter sp. Marseille-P3206]|uniref:tRNA 2-thiouridine(34) synthase MnmA n=1 Tax=Anaerosalibacter sp. Marseille-P3206 TaxID=1871005 RepID=UPI0009861F45|nr:tRNA 2-thiouridine(34) synthase MnmA [Anaerosalibacter sp. Marseille-P3206]
MLKKKVVLGMSGGVDSSVAAYILKESGYDVIGVTMSVIDCSITSVNDAKLVADKLDIPFHILDFKELFERKVIDYFVDEYLNGRTPNPCVKCNKLIKFDEFLKKANEMGADYIATGHYAKIEKDNATGRYLLKRSLDTKKDQTYVLYNLTQYQLEHTLMPLGSYTKEEIRNIAEKIGLKVHNKPDSQEICFIPDDDHGRFIKERVPDKVKSGYFVDEQGNVLGKHKGIVNYTIGQRKGLGIALGKRVFVKDIVPENNTVVLADEEKIFNKVLYAEELNLIPFETISDEMKVTAKIRYGTRESEAIVRKYENGIIVEFKEPQRAITKGQSVVLYDGELVIGGGIIKKIV